MRLAFRRAFSPVLCVSLAPLRTCCPSGRRPRWACRVMRTRYAVTQRASLWAAQRAAHCSGDRCSTHTALRTDIQQQTASQPLGGLFQARLALGARREPSGEQEHLTHRRRSCRISQPPAALTNRWPSPRAQDGALQCPASATAVSKFVGALVNRRGHSRPRDRGREFAPPRANKLLSLTARPAPQLACFCVRL